MRLHVLVEGPSEAALLRGWLPRLLPGHTFKIIQHRGKGRLPADPTRRPEPRRQGLLDQLPAKLRAYGRELNSETDRILVLVDLDEQNCHDLKHRLLAILESCDPAPTVLFRIAIKEMESFYLGDRRALKEAFPAAKLSRLRDHAQDGEAATWKTFAEVIGARVEDKVGWAETMASHLGIAWQGRQKNYSPSFCHLCKALLHLAGEPLN